MLGFLKPRGELVEISGRTVVFLSAKAYKMDQKFEVKLGVPDPPGHTISVAIRVLSCRSGPGDFYVVVGIAEGRREPPELKGYPIRAFPRSVHRVSVKSEGLPGYRCVTSNLGRGGFGAELDGELPDNTVLNVHLEFDEPLGWTLDLRARVAWSVWKSQTRYETGFEFLEEPSTALALEQLGAWLEHWSKKEMVPFKPPEKMAPRPPKSLPNQLPMAEMQMLAAPPSIEMMTDAYRPPTDVQRAAMGVSSVDDDPTPLGLPAMVQPPPRPAALKLPGSVSLERPSAFQLSPPQQAPIPSPSFSPASESMELPPRSQGYAPHIPPAQAAAPTGHVKQGTLPQVEDEDIGVLVHFEANLRGWAWEGADDSVVVVLEDHNGNDCWLEFPSCRGLQARGRQREIRLLGMAVAENSALITELSRHNGETPLLHFRFFDDHHRTVLDLVAADCREQIR